MSNTETNFWLADPSYINSLKKIIPNKNISINKKLNLLTLLLIILTVILLIFVKNKAYALVPIVGIILIVVYYIMNLKSSDDYSDKIKAKKIRLNNLSNKKYTSESMANMTNSTKRNNSTNSIDATAARFFDNDFYDGQSSTDTSSKKLAEWLYKSPTPTCKEDSKYCLRLNYEDLRSSRYNPELS